MLTMLLIRHGEAVGNTEGRLIGQSDVPLSDLGRLQAQRLAAGLADRPIGRIVSSDLSRARDTITPLADHLGIDVEFDRRLREIDNGDWGDLLPHEVDASWPDLWRRYRSGEDVDRPGGESWAAVATRVASALEDIAQSTKSPGVVAVSTHGGPILTTVHLASGLDLGNVFAAGVNVPNASVTTVELPPLRLAGPVGSVDHL